MTPACPVCASDRTRRAASYRGRHPAFTGLSRIACLECEMGFADPMPGDAALAAYNARYFESAHGGTATDRVAVAFHSGINALRVAHVEDFLAKHGVAVSAALEVGPGGGYFARHWIKRHPQTQYHAVESDVSCHPLLRSIGVRVRTHPTGPGTAPRVDLVVLSHVLEHVARPREFLDAVTTSLRSGGALFVEVPCRDWEHKSEDEPHLLFFDKGPMLRLLDSAGFRDIQLTYHGRRITELKRPGLRRRVANAISGRLLRRGIVPPFGGAAPGLEPLDDPLERAAVRPYEAYRLRQEPSWWLRAVALKA